MSSCIEDNWVKGEGPIIHETRQLDSFDRIHLSNDAILIITRDSTFSVKVSVQSNILSKIGTYVSDGNL